MGFYKRAEILSDIQFKIVYLVILPFSVIKNIKSLLCFVDQFKCVDDARET